MQTLSANRPLRQQPRQASRCKGSPGKQGTLRSAGHATNGFLKRQFLPICEPGRELPDAAKVEPGFFNSLKNLSQHFGFEPLPTERFAYPANILMALRHASQKIRINGRYRCLSVTEELGSTVDIVLSETLDIGNTVFYIPVVPLCHWHAKRQNRKAAELLLSVCAYLYYHAGVPYYRDEESYLYYNYEILKDWVEDDKGQVDKCDYINNRNALKSAEYFGDVMERRIKSNTNLTALADRVQAFKPRTEFERSVLAVADIALKLWEQYPSHSLFTNARSPDGSSDEDEDDDYHGTLNIGEYVGFIAEQQSDLHDSLMSMINSEFNEKTRVQEPECRTSFRHLPQADADTLDFDRRLFDLFCELSNLLNELQ